MGEPKCGKFTIQTWIIEIMEEFSYIGILFMMAFENVFPPIQ